MEKSNGFLKVTGILMIIGGVFTIIFSILAVVGVGALAATLGTEADLGLLMVSSIIGLISGVVSLIAGITGAKNANKPEKATACIAFGCLTVLLSILGSILNVVGGNQFSVLGLITGLIVPALYLVGAFQNKKRAGITKAA